MIKKRPILRLNMFFLIMTILLFTGGSIAQGIDIYLGTVFTEVGIIFLISIIYIKLSKKNIKEYLRLNKISLKQIAYAVGITILVYFIAIYLNIIVLSIIEGLGGNTFNNVPMPTSLPLYIKSLFVIGLMPGICEEIMFRGVVLRGYEGLGRNKAVLISAILFGMFHYDIGNFVGPFILGLVGAILLYKSNSILTPIVCHISFNSIGMTLAYIATRFAGDVDGGSVEDAENMGIYISYFILIGLFTIAINLVVKLIKDFPKTKSKEDKDQITIVEIDLYEGREENIVTDRIGPNYREEIVAKKRFTDYLPLVLLLVFYIYINYYSYFKLTLEDFYV